MRRWAIAICVALCLFSTSFAEERDVRSLFLSIPEAVLPHFEPEHRVALLEQYDRDRAGYIEDAIVVINNFQGRSSITQIADGFMAIRLDEEVTLQIKMLMDGRGNSVISLLYTTTSLPHMSVLTFYDDEWRRLPNEEFIEMPSWSQFLQDPSIAETNEVKMVMNAIGPLLYRCQWMSDSDVMTIQATTFENQVQAKLYPEVMKWLKSGGLRYIWQHGKLQNEA